MRALIAVALSLSLAGCSLGFSDSAEKQEENVFQLEPDRVKVDPGSGLLNHLEIIALGTYSSRQVAYQSVGKMIALSTPSDELVGPRTTWIELDSASTHAAHLSLSPEAAGTAYGVTSIPAEFLSQIKSRHSIRVKHYQVAEPGWEGTIVKVLPTADPNTADVVFRVPHGNDLYPGTGCEVKFPLVHAVAVKVPSTALVHEGVDDYVWQELSPGTYAPRKVSLAEGTADEVILSSGISADSKIIGRGAILLKPELKPILNLAEEHQRASSANRGRAQ